MAKNIKEKASKPEGVSAEDLKRAVAEITRQKKSAAEYTSNAGTVARGAIEKHGLEKTAFTIARKLSEMETAKRDAIVIASLDYFEKLGFLDGGLFNEGLIARLQSIIDRNHNTAGASRSDDERAVDGALLSNV